MHRSTRFTLLAVGLLASASTTTARAQGQIQIRVTNLAPSNGTALTPVWLGIHSGSFSTFAPGQSASIALERLAEDGNTSPLMAAFSAAGFTTQTTLLGPGGAFLPSESSVATFMLNPANAQTRYLSYASMLLPSNDAFIGNASGTAIDLTDGMGHLRSFSFFVLGSQVWDAGTEVNDELASSTAFFGQSTPNTGTDENGAVRLHSGFTPGGRILTASQFANANFLQPGFQVARFDVTVTPEPSTWLLMATGLIAIGVGAKRRQRRT